jgi:tetratricopeptide (TPR) repeat protein
LSRRPAAALAAACALAMSVALGGCAAWLPPPQTRGLLSAPPAGLPPQAERDSVPFFPQTPFHCGPAALATVLSDAGLPTLPDALADSLFLPAREGTLQTEILAGARRQGALAYRLPGTLPALFTEVAEGRPVVVLQNLGLGISPRWHYAVLVGYDLSKREVVLRSGTTRRELMALATFELTWARGGHWAFVALPPGRLPATVTEPEALSAAIGFERSAAPALAARAYETLLSRWPGLLLAQLGLGNTRLAAGDRNGAAQAYAQAAERHDSAVAWNNLAQVQMQLGQREAARVSAQRAVDRASAKEPAWLTAAQATLREAAAVAAR